MPRKPPLEKMLTTIAIFILLCASPAIGVELGRLIGGVWR